MKIKKIFSVNMVTLFSAFIFFICIRVSYISLGVQLTLLLKVMSILVLFTLFIVKQRIPKSILVISGWYVIILFSTLVNGRDIINAVNSLTSPYLISLFIAYFNNSINNKLRVLEVWAYLLLALCIVDGITILLYPNGMPTASYYELTWFLGYKTARLVYSLPLVILFPYLSYLKKGSLNKISVAVILLCTIITFFAQARAASIAMLLYLVLIIIMESLRKKDIKSLVYKLLNYKVLLVGYSFAFVIITVVQTNPIIQYIIQNIFHKSSDLSNRTGIWTACLERFYNNPIIGNGYLTNAEYIIITNFDLGTSPHSFVLSILVTSGLVGLLYYVFMFYYFFRRRSGQYEYHEIVVLFGLISILLLGLTSSVMTFAVFSTFIFQLIGFKFNGDILIKRRLFYELKK